MTAVPGEIEFGNQLKSGQFIFREKPGSGIRNDMSLEKTVMRNSKVKFTKIWQTLQYNTQHDISYAIFRISRFGSTPPIHDDNIL